MELPIEIVSRKDEIAVEFLKLMEQHLQDLLHKRVEYRHHATQFAQQLFIHPRHLTNTIKLALGKSPCDFMEARMLEEAQRMLRETDYSIADIGSRLGYNDPSNFIKFFKGMCGSTPLQFRKQLSSNTAS